MLTDSFIFLSGTPHQGRTDQFVNVLLLLRPDLKSRLGAMFSDPSVVGEVVLRNRKSLVTDASGKFLFCGQDTNLVEVPLSEAAADFDVQLRRYIRYGYAASEAGGVTGRAVGFVMTTYRKLASSSIAAIERALERRRARLTGELASASDRMSHDRFEELQDVFEEGDDGEDDLDAISDEVSVMGAGSNPFFANEMQMLNELCMAAKVVRADDRKLAEFLTSIVDPVHGNGLKLLVFTEYRGTQDYLVDALAQRYPGSGVCSINGGMSLDKKREQIDAFNDHAQFMVSTEAGGEGINLHYSCYMLVNYDLPWNPRRLVQRAGRLYRYGQTERVVVFNLVAQDGFDNKALGMLLNRVSTIAHDMSDVSPEFHEGLETEIVGALLERVDIAQILANSREMVIDQRSEAEIDEAVERAKQSQSLQEQLFAHIEGYDPNTTAALHTFGPEEVLSFLEGVLPRRGIRIRDRLHNGRVLELELSEEMRGRYSEFGGRTVVRVTVDRRLAIRDERNVSMDFASVFFSDLIEFAKSPEFGGEHASLRAPKEGVLGIYKVRWQNDQGLPRWEMLVPVFLSTGSEAALPNPDFFGSLLHSSDAPASAPHPGPVVGRRETLKRLDECAAAVLAERCTPLRHPNDLVLLAAADLQGQ
ncbi:MAG: helicase-related protein [Gammaproteobacteria bacterium]|nr:helicase-related protein [Gammaproteobacteria bacterium]